MLEECGGYLQHRLDRRGDDGGRDPRSRESIVAADDFRVDAGGTARWFSILGDDALGRRVHAMLRSRGIDVTSVTWDDRARTGLYVKDPGAPVSYYRADSAASRLNRSHVERLGLSDVALVHMTGITPALSADAADAVDALVARAHDAGVRVSFDVNHRPALWRAEVVAPALLRLAQCSDIVFVGLDEAARLWGHETPESVRQAIEAPATLFVKDGSRGATEFTGAVATFLPVLVVDVVEEVGAGGAFAGGYLAAMLRGEDAAAQLTAAHAQATLALTTTSDSLEDRIHDR